jgi:hypothetical protein
LWGKPKAFDRENPFYQAIRQIAQVRESQPALRYGRQYFRPISGDGRQFGFSNFPGGILAFSRILSDQEVVVVANTNTQVGWQGEVLVDYSINPAGTNYRVVFSNKKNPPEPAPVAEKLAGSIEIHGLDESIAYGPTRVLPIKLQPMEIQILDKAKEK